jgi:hypothetical protein
MGYAAALSVWYKRTGFSARGARVVVLGRCCRRTRSRGLLPIQLTTGLSRGGFYSLGAAREYARQEAMAAWIFFAEMCVLSATIRV